MSSSSSSIWGHRSLKFYTLFPPMISWWFSSQMHRWSSHSLSFQHLLEGLVDKVYKSMQREFIYKRDGVGKLVTPQNRLADPSHGSAIRSFQSSDELKSRLPKEFWSNAKWECKIYHLLSNVITVSQTSEAHQRRNKKCLLNHCFHVRNASFIS